MNEHIRRERERKKQPPTTTTTKRTANEIHRMPPEKRTEDAEQTMRWETGRCTNEEK